MATIAKLLTIAGAAREIGTSRDTVRRLIADGKLPVVNLRGRNRVRVSDVAKLTNAVETKGGAK